MVPRSLFVLVSKKCNRIEMESWNTAELCWCCGGLSEIWNVLQQFSKDRMNESVEVNESDAEKRPDRSSGLISGLKNVPVYFLTDFCGI